MVQYLLPCQCGRKTPIDSTKAGQTIECECGRRIEVPTLGEMRKLQRVAHAKMPVTSVKWAARQRLFFLGILICVVGLGIAGIFSVSRPVPPPHQQRIDLIPQYVGNLSLMETIQLWGNLERGLPEGLGLEDQAYQIERKAYLHRTGVALFIAGVGILMAVASLCIPKKRVRG